MRVKASSTALEDENIGCGKFVKVVLSVDHRPVDGALAAQWPLTVRWLLNGCDG
ncbi:MAG: 2-oxo acid dehydrogenase subunit E2 [Dermatophilaceae bacterium]